MIWAIIGLTLGIIVGGSLPITYPSSYSLYISIAMLAALDSLIGAIRANMEKKYNNLLFISGFFSNALLAGLLSYFGDRLGVPFFYAPMIVFGGRLFQNVAIIRRLLISSK
ncbi:MAG: small basic family protein [Peptostreptococcaceae bacterium]|nr:small basic family protein [Peptostreptococcaceae bacterium]